jgi:hypothetical protein
MEVERTLLICVSPGLHGRWDVSEKGSEAPLASFNAKEEACAYAASLMEVRGETTVLVEDVEGFYALPSRGNSHARSSF